ncbi:hypothetical protein PanABDRAFT_2493 [Pantoea sp. aB]|nr:hypothetical protein PanABDRAFT_2493 [Pantoea sp. aB]
MKRLLLLLLLSTNCLAIQVTTTQLSSKGNKHFVSTVWTVDTDIDEEINVRWGSSREYNGGIFTIIHNGVAVFSGLPSFVPANASHEVKTRVHIKKGDTLQGLIDNNASSDAIYTSTRVGMIVGDGRYGIWNQTEFYTYYTYPCNATVPVAIDLGVLNPGDITPVYIPLEVSSPGRLKFNVGNNKGVIPLKRDAETILSLDLSSYYNATYDSIFWTSASGTTINGTVIVPQDSVGGVGSVAGSITLDCI